ncbi:hypothetical protein AAY473_008145 [Plecturocebus cupreus]
MGPAEPDRPVYSAPRSATLAKQPRQPKESRWRPMESPSVVQAGVQVAQSWLTAASFSQRWDFTMLVRLVLNSWPCNLPTLPFQICPYYKNCGKHRKRQSLTLLPSWSVVARSRLFTTSASQVQAILLPQPPKPVDSRQRRHTGCQRDSFGQCGCFAGAPARRFPVQSIRDRRARLVPSPQGKQQLEALRTESFIASTANPGRSGSAGNGHPPKEN